MPELFGLDIAEEVFDALADDLLDGTLVKRKRAEPGPNQPKGEVIYTKESHPFIGIIEEFTIQGRDNTTVREIGRSVLMLGASLPAGVVPQIGDEVVMEGMEFRIGSIKRDPAAATYTCDVT